MSLHLGQVTLVPRAFRLTADGGSRGNPGPAGYGAVITENGKIVAELYDFIGIETNNVAEYNGLLAGLRKVHELDSSATVDVRMDSKLVVEQMSGGWQIKHPGMRELAKLCRDAHDPRLVSYTWIPRDENSHADRLANKAMDAESGSATSATIEASHQKNYLTERLRSGETPTMIYLVRHGETPLTPDRKFSGSGGGDPALTDEGEKQAAGVAAEIAKIRPDVLITSPMLRAKQTAEAIASVTGLVLVEDEIWTEMSFGYWDGLSFDEVREQYPDELQGWLNSAAFKAGGGESYEEAMVRIEEALEKVAQEYSGKKVCIVSHNGVIKVAALLAMGAPIDSVFHVDAAPCSITSISIWPSDGLRALRSINERGHQR